METQKIREKFLRYFEKEHHRHVTSSSVIPHEDPTLLFINAGMNQFKDVFLGKSQRDYERACTSQKCIRVGGKHNDLENVGHTKRHLTFFEMLGNFSFGDYFKKDAIRFAWEVSTEVFGFDSERIWPTVFREDDEAFELWQAYVPAEKIYRFDEADNYWAMGDTGPQGPCSELLFDRGEAFGSAKNPKEDHSGERYLEFWNLVFMQYNKARDGSLSPLPKPSIDTGAGLERIVSLKMDADSVFETDILRALIAEVENQSQKPYHGQAAHRVIADHLRSLAFAIADGAQPSNVERGYVLRKILRRAVRYGKTIGFKEPFLAKMLPRLVSEMGSHYTELRTAETRIAEILTTEEEAFFRTLKRGGGLLSHVVEEAKKLGGTISGQAAFKLKDTYGLPLEEIELIAIDGGLSIDKKTFEVLEKEAKERSRKAHKKTAQLAENNTYADYAQKDPFCGYENLSLEGAKVLAVVEEDDGVGIVLNKTPFYPEKGGQVGDSGTLSSGKTTLRVTDCQEPYPGVIVHRAKVQSGRLNVGDKVLAKVNKERRDHIRRNHTATHLLHWALHEVLGQHVRQAGSVVDDERLRFDFNHHKAMSREEMTKVETLVNGKIRENVSVKPYEVSYKDVMARDEIKQFFGDKYGERVRVVDMDFSKELCGGTHVEQTGQIGYFRIAEESSIAAGVRRVTAITGEKAEVFAKASEETLSTIADVLKTQTGKIIKRIQKLQEENKSLAKALKGEQKKQLLTLVQDLLKEREDIGGVTCIISQVPVGGKELKDLGERAMEALGSGVLMLAASSDGTCKLLARVSPDQVKEGVTARALIEKAAPIIGGRGGGKADMAQAGGPNVDKIDEALDHTKTVIRKRAW